MPENKLATLAEGYFTMIIESDEFDELNTADREILLAKISTQCTNWIADREEF